MALQLDIINIDKESMKKSIRQLLTDTRFAEKAKDRSRAFRDQPEKPLERALWYFDYIVRNPDVSFLKSEKLQRMNMFVKHSFDVIAFLVIIATILLLVLIKVTCVVLRKTKKGTNNKVKRQ